MNARSGTRPDAEPDEASEAAGLPQRSSGADVKGGQAGAAASCSRADGQIEQISDCTESEQGARETRESVISTNQPVPLSLRFGKSRVLTDHALGQLPFTLPAVSCCRRRRRRCNLLRGSRSTDDAIAA